MPFGSSQERSYVCFASRRELLLENLVLRQQLMVLKRKHPRPRLAAFDESFWVLTRRFWTGWKRAARVHPLHELVGQALRVPLARRSALGPDLGTLAARLRTVVPVHHLPLRTEVLHLGSLDSLSPCGRQRAR